MRGETQKSRNRPAVFISPTLNIQVISDVLGLSFGDHCCQNSQAVPPPSPPPHPQRCIAPSLC